MMFNTRFPQSLLPTKVIQGAIAALGVLLIGSQAPALGQSLRQKVYFANSDLNTFWARSFQALEKPWKSPTAYQYSRGVRTPCGFAGPNNAIYCSVNHSIYLNIPFLVKANSLWGDFAAITIIAHEYGHAVQRQLGLSRINRYLYQEELQADCLAGVYAQDAGRRGLLDATDLREGYFQSYSSGHAQFNPNTHGTRSQRANAFRLGYGQGFRSCLTYSKLR